MKLFHSIKKQTLRTFTSAIALVLITTLATTTVEAQSFQMNENCNKAYKAFMSMKNNEGRAYLIKELASNKENFLPIVLFNYDDFISLTFNENPEEYKKRKPLFEKRLKLLETADKNSPYFLFSKGLLYFQWSAIQIKYADYWNAAWDFRRAFLIFKENKKKYPDFTYNDLYIGAQEAVISTIPNGYKWISKILGMKGNMKSGMWMLNHFAKSNHPNFKEEAYLFLIYLKNYLENEPKEAFQIIKDENLDIQNNQLFAFMAANLALNNKNASTAEQILLNRNKSKDYISFPMLDYEMGDAKMRRLDMGAIVHYENFIKNYKGNFYIKDACYNIALCYYLQGKIEMANTYKQKTKTLGKLESDADKQAQKNALKNNFPNKELLKVRLLNDGGYNEKALEILSNIQKLNSEQTLEYYYRLARVQDDLNQDEKAIANYLKVIELGSDSKEYFAARAALQTGYIYEQKGNKQLALKYFNIVLDLDDHEYKNSLDQRAKSSINRIYGN